ncbi:hypothetical protein HII31_05228 [Pseudocercospora fuligena]|uniref:Uncharacterized protein n=1 Tax=Pseudocercospora fuligena TaxID=685502 RepID=A0A8H6RMC3_9PEZI|nr:hypothetical protein HII31_05228 [Pseudocercospora fuligena]
MTTCSVVSRRDIFPFFSLPREIRDQIYQEPALIDEQNTIDFADRDCQPWMLNTAGQPLPLHISLTLTDSDDLEIRTYTKKPNLMTICKQFHDEYNDAIEVACSKLVITDKFAHGDAGDVELPSWTKNCTKVQFNLSLFGDLDFYSPDVLVNQTMRQLPRASELHIRVNFTPTALDCMLPLTMEQIRNFLNKDLLPIDGLKTLDVYSVEEPIAWLGYWPLFTFEEDDKPVLKYSEELKKVELVEEGQG